LNFDPRISKIDAYKSGYIDKELEQIVGLQTESPLTRAFMPYGGIRMADSAAISHGFKTNPETDVFFAKYHKTHNQGVFDAYTEEITRARHTHIITGLPDAYARGRIIGDYRRVALYGIDYLINEKIVARNNATLDVLNAKNIRMREETMEQIKSLKAMLNMAKSYGFDISRPAKNAKEAIQ
jgi:formate C-acetyltransferase